MQDAKSFANETDSISTLNAVESKNNTQTHLPSDTTDPRVVRHVKLQTTATGNVRHGYKEDASRADANLLNKSAVFDVLTAAGITEVAVASDGYGDSGQIQTINAYIGETEVELPKSPLTVHEFQ